MDYITLDKTWLSSQYPVDYSVYNTDALIGKYTLWAIKEALVDAGFVVTYSSDSTVPGTGAGDNWTDYSKIIGAAGAHSWVVLKKSTWQADAAICIDRNFSDAEYNQVALVFAANGFNADGTYLARPTAVSTSVAWDNFYFRNLLSSSEYGTSVNCLYSSDNTCTRLYVTANGVNTGLVLFFETPKYSVSWWPSPWAFYSSVYAGGTGLNYISLTTDGANNFITYIDGNLIQLRLGTIGVNDWLTNQYSFGLDTNGGYIMPPMYLISQTISYPGILGILYDAYPSHPAHISGTRYKTVENSRGLLKVGCLALGCPYGPMTL